MPYHAPVSEMVFMMNAAAGLDAGVAVARGHDAAVLGGEAEEVEVEREVEEVAGPELVAVKACDGGEEALAAGASEESWEEFESERSEGEGEELESCAVRGADIEDPGAQRDREQE